MRTALEEYEAKINTGQDAVQEDMLFHIRIAQSTKNSVIESMIFILIPDLIKNIIESKICGNDRGRKAIVEHHQIFQAILKNDIDAAENAMASHLDEILQISRTGFNATKLINEKNKN